MYCFYLENYISQWVSYIFFYQNMFCALFSSDRSHIFWLGIGVGNLMLFCATLVENSTLTGVGSFLPPPFSWPHQVEVMLPLDPHGLLC